MLATPLHLEGEIGFIDRRGGTLGLARFAPAQFGSILFFGDKAETDNGLVATAASCALVVSVNERLLQPDVLVVVVGHNDKTIFARFELFLDGTALGALGFHERLFVVFVDDNFGAKVLDVRNELELASVLRRFFHGGSESLFGINQHVITVGIGVNISHAVVLEFNRIRGRVALQRKKDRLLAQHAQGIFTEIRNRHAGKEGLCDDDDDNGDSQERAMEGEFGTNTIKRKQYSTSESRKRSDQKGYRAPSPALSLLVQKEENSEPIVASFATYLRHSPRRL